MSERFSPLAGKPAPPDTLVDLERLRVDYENLVPDPAIPAQRVAFGTSGHRGVPGERSFNRAHILAIAQAICDYRRQQGIEGPLFLGADSHALSAPAHDDALEVLAANGVAVHVAQDGDFVPTPALSHAILVHNRGRESGLADGIVVTPSHNPPDNGGFKYNPPNGGPADTDVTGWIQQRANALLEARLASVRRLPLAQARRAATTQAYDYRGRYIDDLANVIDFDAIRAAGVRLGVDPLGGAGVRYWAPIAERYRIDLSVVSERIDPQFGFMTLDWDGKIRMDPSSPCAMQRLIGMKDAYDVAAACDTDHDRHGIVTPQGLMEPNGYLATMIDYLFRHRPGWPAAAGVGKTVVSTALIDRVAQRLERPLFETPVGFKWFAPGLFDGSLGFGGEESAGASFLRRDGTVWTTDKDGIVPCLLAAEITARRGRNPAEAYAELTAELGKPVFDRVEAPATPAQKAKLSKLSAADFHGSELAGERIEQVLDRAPGNGAGIGGIKVIARNGWFAARPSGTEAIYKIYGESFAGDGHLRAVLAEAQQLVDRAIA